MKLARFQRISKLNNLRQFRLGKNQNTEGLQSKAVNVHNPSTLTIDLEQRRDKRVKRPERHSDRITLAQIVPASCLKLTGYANNAHCYKLLPLVANGEYDV